MWLSALGFILVLALFIVVLVLVASRQQLYLSRANQNLDATFMVCRQLVMTHGRLPQTGQEIQTELFRLGMELRHPVSQQPMRLFYYSGYRPPAKPTRWQVLVYHDRQRHLLTISAIDGHGDGLRTELVDEHFHPNTLDLVANK